MNVLETHNLHKTYGRITAVNQLNLNVKAGTVFGLLGPNGSGKTTTLGMILGVTTPSSGGFSWFGKTPTHHQRKKVGAILEKPNFYPTFSAYKNLVLACKIKEVSSDRIHPVLEQVGLLDRKDDPFKTYSLGMKQRLAIGSAMLANPDVLIFDEPTNGLDPKGIAEIRQLILDIAETGKTIILASHLLDEVQKVCSDFAILRKGHLLHTGKVNPEQEEYIILEIGAEDLGSALESVQRAPGYISHKILRDKLEVTFETHIRPADVNRHLAESGIYAGHLNTIKKTLEQQFMEIVTNYA
ncbi:MAG: ATP-binding cassette domain-containing protein [Bacteroidota bacterium]